MAPSTHLEVLRIPCNGSSMSLAKIPLITIGPCGITKAECNNLEKHLLHLPQLKSLDSPKSFRWASRTLVAYTKNDARHGPLNGVYMMYFCLDERSELPHNEYLEELVNLGRGPEIPTVPFKVYGDAYIFRLESTSSGLDEHRPAEYVDMDRGFVNSALSRGEVGTWAFCLLRMLLLCPHRRA